MYIWRSGQQGLKHLLHNEANEVNGPLFSAKTQWRLSFSELWSWPNKQFHVVPLWYTSDSQTTVGIVIDLHTSCASRANTQKEINKNPISKTKLWSREKRLCSGLCVERARRGRVMENAQVVAGIKVLLLLGIPLLFARNLKLLNSCRA